MNKLFNIGKPRKVLINIEMKPIDKYVLFKYELYEKNQINSLEVDLNDGSKNFMLGIKATKEILDSIDKNNLIVCNDFKMYCKVIYKMVDDIYIPSRKPNINKTIEKEDWLFLYNEVYEND